MIGAFPLQPRQGISPPAQCKLHWCLAKPVYQDRVLADAGALKTRRAIFLSGQMSSQAMARHTRYRCDGRTRLPSVNALSEFCTYVEATTIRYIIVRDQSHSRSEEPARSFEARGAGDVQTRLTATVAQRVIC